MCMRARVDLLYIKICNEHTLNFCKKYFSAYTLSPFYHLDKLSNSIDRGRGVIIQDYKVHGNTLFFLFSKTILFCHFEITRYSK